MNTLVQFLSTNYLSLWEIFASVVTVASLVASLLPKSHLNDDVNALIRVLNMVALNFKLPTIAQPVATDTAAPAPVAATTTTAQ